MAKTKSDENQLTVDVSKEITSKYGKDIVLDAATVLDEETQIIPVSPMLDLGLSGGIPEGSWFTLTGRPKTGKSVTALHFAAKCQRPEYGSREIFYLNIEGRLKKMNLSGAKGLDLSKIKIISSQKGNLLSAEDYLGIAETIINSVPGAVLIIDSYSALCTESEITKGMDEQQRSDGQKLLAKFCRRLANNVPINKSIIVGITHLMGNPSGYGLAEKEKGGFAISYQADAKIKAGSIEKLTGKNGRQYGQKVEWSVEVSALGPPGAKISSTIVYGIGIDEIAELVDLSLELRLVEMAGSWCYVKNDLFADEFKFKDGDKFHGKEKLIDTLKSNPDLCFKLEAQTRRLLYNK